MSKGGVRIGAGRPKKQANDKVQYITKTIKFKNSEVSLLDFINNFEGKNFSEKIKNIVSKQIEKK